MICMYLLSWSDSFWHHTHDDSVIVHTEGPWPLIFRYNWKAKSSVSLNSNLPTTSLLSVVFNILNLQIMSGFFTYLPETMGAIIETRGKLIEHTDNSIRVEDVSTLSSCVLAHQEFDESTQLMIMIHKGCRTHSCSCKELPSVFQSNPCADYFSEVSTFYKIACALSPPFLLIICDGTQAQALSGKCSRSTSSLSLQTLSVGSYTIEWVQSLPCSMHVVLWLSPYPLLLHGVIVLVL